MADLSKTIDIILNGKDHASTALRTVSGSMGKMKDSFARIAKVGFQAGAAITAVSTAVSALAAAGLKKAYDQSVNFESAMVDLKKVLGDQPDLLDQAKQSALELSSQYGISSTTITDSIANWVQAGYDLEEATLLAEESIALLYTSELTAEEATVGLTKIMKGFGIETDDARSKLDVLNEISNNYAANVGMLVDALSRAAPEAQAVGVSMEELAALMTPAIEKFQDGQKVGTAYKTMLTKLVDDSGPVTEALSTLGVAQKDANGDLRSGRDILFDVGEAFQELEPNQKAFVAAQIAGREHSGKFLATMNDWDQVTEVYNTAMDSAGSVTEELGAQLESSQRQLDRYGVAWENLGIAIGDQYRVATTEAVGGATDLVSALQSSVDDGAFDEVFSVIEEAASDLGETLSGMAEALPEALESVDYSELADSLEDVKDAVSGLFDGLDLTDPEDLAEIIQRIVDAGGNIIEFSAQIIGALGPVADAVLWSIETFNDFFEAIGRIDGPSDIFVAGIEIMLLAVESLYDVLSLIPGVDFSSFSEGVEQTRERLGDWADGADTAKTKTEELQTAIGHVPTEKETKVDVDDDGSTQTVIDKTDEIPAEKELEIKAKMDLAEIEAQTERMEIQADVDISMIEAKTERLIAALELEGLNVEATTARIESMYDFKAEAVVAEADKITVAFDASASAIGSISSEIVSLSGLLDNTDLNYWQRGNIENFIQQQLDQQQQLVDSQTDLTDTQTALAQLKIDRLESGEALIQIDSTGLEPALEQVMWSIMEKVQLRVAMEEAELLLGLGAEVPGGG